MGTRTIEVSDLFKSMIRGMMKELHKKEQESIKLTSQSMELIDKVVDKIFILQKEMEEWMKEENPKIQ